MLTHNEKELIGSITGQSSNAERKSDMVLVLALSRFEDIHDPEAPQSFYGMIALVNEARADVNQWWDQTYMGKQ